ncbi:class I SAM-dependent methyltransferase [Gordonia sp. NB41Y]|uniref:class I SAM-dependent methyltransferase n=1 Tax=Gordonia sp. NB41Y TaxID=875808 RepID=UPI0002BD6E51|nr:class I SAM-dependent methyltransferase [Gordonia sp. NB41Y]WLP90549.1 class I SAM-dependent methyltransferase [Gordonia sp. NB41Y]
MSRPGYDALADLYVQTFGSPYPTPADREIIEAFAGLVVESGLAGTVVDVGCGPGQVTAHLVASGLDAIGVDPSTEMLRHARRLHPHVRHLADDAHLCAEGLREIPIAAILARYSLIHVSPSDIPEILTGWAARMPSGAMVCVAGQSSDVVGEVVEFDHRVARAWRWHPDAMSEALGRAGFDEHSRTVVRPDAHRRFPEATLIARRR